MPQVDGPSPDRDSRTSIQPAPSLGLPSINPFLQLGNAKASADWQNNRWDEAKFRAEGVRAAEEDRENAVERDLLTAKDIYFKDCHLKSEDADWKRMDEVVCFRRGTLKERDIGLILRSIQGVNGSNFKKYRNKLIRRENSIQNETLSYLLTSMRHLVTLVGADTWKAASRPERAALLKRLFKQAKCTISRNTFHTECFAVDFENTLSRQSDGRLTWQKVVMTKFTNMALATYDHRIATDDRKAMVAVYKGLMQSDTMHSLKLGGHGDLPAKVHRERGVAGVKWRR